EERTESAEARVAGVALEVAHAVSERGRAVRLEAQRVGQREAAAAKRRLVSARVIDGAAERGQRGGTCGAHLLVGDADLAAGEPGFLAAADDRAQDVIERERDGIGGGSGDGCGAWRRLRRRGGRGRDE